MSSYRCLAQIVKIYDFVSTLWLLLSGTTCHRNTAPAPKAGRSRDVQRESTGAGGGKAARAEEPGDSVELRGNSHDLEAANTRVTETIVHEKGATSLYQRTLVGTMKGASNQGSGI